MTGSAANALAVVDREISAAQTELESADKEIELLFVKHKDFLEASEEELSIQVEKGEIPVRIATSEYTFVIDAWVPEKKAESVKEMIESKVEGTYVEIQETRSRSLEGSEEIEARFREPPTKMNNGKIAKEFEYPTKLVAVPKYQEIDPSVLIAIFFPLFFGFMVGDVGYAIPFIILGAYGLKVTHNKDWRAIATVFFFGGIWAFIFGFLFFGEFLGMHFVGMPEEGAVTHTWQQMFEVYFGISGAGLEEFFGGILPAGHGVGKIDAEWIGFLMKLTVYIGIVHLLLGYICSIYNKTIQHGFKHAFLEKGGWLFAFLGIVIMCYGLANYLIYGIPTGAAISTIEMACLIVGVVLIVVGTVLNRHEGAQAILELPGIVGNVLSYARLAAIGMSKAGMALAFNYIAIDMFYGSVGGIGGVILAIVMMAFGHLMIWVLAIISAGLHGLRLQYVEFMAKFFEGGGVEFEPLKIKRKKTISNAKNATSEV